jgi:general secretion pathway protein D
MRVLKSVVAQLDIRRAQVMVEAIVAEVSYNKAAQLGVSWVIDGTEGGNIVGLTKFTSALNVTDIGGALVGDDQQIAQALQAIPDGASVGIGDFSGSTRWAAIIRALLGDASTNVLATPTIMTLDNEEAELSVGQEVPFVTGQFTNTGAAQGSVNPFQTIQREDVGLKLKVTPQINEGDALILEIQLENSNLQASSQGAVDLITNERTITQKVLVENGQVLVMGGLVDDQIVEIDEKVPFLGDIPFAGNLFKSQSSTVTKRTLMVFIRPVIIRDAKTASDLTNKKYRLMRGVQLGEREEGDVLMMKDLRRPVMPELPEGGLPPETPTGIMGRDPSIYPTVKPEAGAETESDSEGAPEEPAPPTEESQ